MGVILSSVESMVGGPYARPFECIKLTADRKGKAIDKVSNEQIAELEANRVSSIHRQHYTSDVFCSI
jgi:hypothetical protein